MTGEDFNVQSVEPIDPEPRTADSLWWRVAVDDGTIPAAIKVWVTGTDAAKIPNDGLEEFVGAELRATVQDVPTGEAKVKALRTLSPIRLYPVTDGD